MTGQIADTVVYDGEGHVVTGVSGGGLFELEAYRMAPDRVSTACWRGYVCSYAIRDDRLLRRAY
jgi:hypothetical protein